MTALTKTCEATFRFVELDRLRNNTGITIASHTGVGAFNVWRNSLPAEELPLGRTIDVHGIPFAFPEAGLSGGENGRRGHGIPDNVRCEGQLVAMPAGRYDWLYVLAAAERRVEDEIVFHYADGTVDFEPFRISDFWAAEPAFGERAAFTTTAMHYPHHVQRNLPAMIWCHRVPVTRGAPVRAARLPHNIAVHVFAATLMAHAGWSR